MSSTLHWFSEITDLSDLAVTLAAMANTDGGTVVVGLAPRLAKKPPGAGAAVGIRGVRNPAETLDRIFQAALMSEPSLVLPMPKIATCGGAPLVVVTVPPGLPNVYPVGGRYYGRMGAHNEPLPPRRLRQLLMERGVVQFESEVPPGATLDDLDMDQVQAYWAGLDLPNLGLPPETEAWQQFLLRRGCLRSIDGQLVPTNAGILLFGRHPQQYLPSAVIQAARFAGKTFSDQFIKQELHGSLLVQLRQAEAFLRQNMRSLVKMTGLAHEEAAEYPFEAVRELLVNAVAHRDYNAQGDLIHLHLFSDRLEVHSPGALPGPVNLENLLQARFARNAVITQVLADLGFVERLGYGLDRVVAAMEQAGLPPPHFEEIARSFRVTLYNEVDNLRREHLRVDQELAEMAAFLKLGLNSRQKKALAYLLRHERITNHEFQELCPKVHVETLRRDLVELVLLGLLIKIGDKRATYYILKKEPDQE